MVDDKFTAEIIETEIARAALRSRTERAVEITLPSSLGDENVIFTVQKGRLICDYLTQEQAEFLAMVPGFFVEGFEPAVRVREAIDDHFAKAVRDAAIEKAGIGNLPSKREELEAMMATIANALGRPQSAPSAPSVTRVQLSQAKLDDQAKDELLVMAQREGAEIDRAARGADLKLFAAIAKFAKGDREMNDKILEVIDESALRAELAVLGEDEVVVEDEVEDVVVETKAEEQVEKRVDIKK